ncbi:MAG: deoxyribose-phosphate aldolase [Erysipelotrichales bacterium]|nr:MAG: deoxyribose-phosphate aldolase [Erysipelotrichales bacterium]
MTLNKYIDHTLLKQNSTLNQITKLCDEARTHGFASVCINPTWVKTCADLLQGSEVKVCTVIGFPLGATTTAEKAFETSTALNEGAEEFDMVINIGALIDRRLDFVRDDIKAVVHAASGKTVKVIIETCLLSDEEKVLACNAAVEAGAHFVKTSTGFSSAGATVQDVALMKETVKGKALVKAAGGVRSIEDMQAMIAAGADRIGTSSGVQLVAGEKITHGY